MGILHTDRHITRRIAFKGRITVTKATTTPTTPTVRVYKIYFNFQNIRIVVTSGTKTSLRYI